MLTNESTALAFPPSREFTDPRRERCSRHTGGRRPMATAPTVRYLAPDAFTRRVFNPIVARLTRWGISVKGSRILEVRGRSSGTTRSTVVNLLTVDGVRYLVAPRGETQWVRNVRADGGRGVLRLGRRSEAITATELPDDAKRPVL